MKSLTKNTRNRIKTKLTVENIASNSCESVDHPVHASPFPIAPAQSTEEQIQLLSRSKVSGAFLSPLRYPGGKSRLSATLLELFPRFETYREPFLGGASVFLRLRANSLGSAWELSDRDARLVNFWRCVQGSPDLLVQEIQRIRAEFANGRELFEYVGQLSNEGCSDAAHYFLRNRISFSGNQSTGGYSEQAFQKRLTEASIEKIHSASKLMKNALLLKGDYSSALMNPGKDVFLFLDPPYFAAKGSRLYGAKGRLHSNFDHERFIETLMVSQHRWLVTYDDSEQIRSFFEGSPGIRIRRLSMFYSSSNLHGANSRLGHEIVITNF